MVYRGVTMRRRWKRKGDMIIQKRWRWRRKTRLKKNRNFQHTYMNYLKVTINCGY